MARKMCRLFIALCALLSLIAIVYAAPVLEQRRPALVQGEIVQVLSPSVGMHRPGRRTVLHRRAASLSTRSGAQWTTRAGDTGNKIASQVGIKFFQLAFLNPTVRWRFLQVSQTLNIPGDGGSSSSHIYVVVAGDTGNTIAAANGISFTQLDTFNRNVDWYNLQIGQFLVVPSPYVPSPYMNVTRASQLPDIDQADPDADVPASSLDLPVAPVVDDNIAEATTTTKRISPFLIPGETPSPSDEFSSGSVGALQVRGARRGKQAINASVGAGASRAVNVSPADQSNKQIPGVYVTYQGSVSTAQTPYPTMSSWIPFGQLWDMNSGNIGTTCSFASGTFPANTESETAALRSAILDVSSETNVKPSFILAMVLQESNGCVRVPTTSSWEQFQNPGLLQSFKGRVSCNSNGRMRQPCPQFMMKGMILEGVRGTKDVNTGRFVGIMPTLMGLAAQAGSQWPLTDEVNANASISANTQGQPDDAIFYYQAARIYNSGSLSADGDLSAPTGSTRCYVSDVANRLMGWTGSGSCSLR